MNYDVGNTVLTSINNGLYAVISFIPKFVAGTIILLIGIILASILKQIILEVFKALKIEALLRRYGVPEAKEEFTWSNILAELIRWFVIVLFLVPTTEVWELPQVATILNSFLKYIPNVFVASIILMVGFVFAKLAHDIVLASARGIAKETSGTIASITRWSVIVFAMLAALNQLGIASDLIKILFTGFVAMVALAGGIAFGLGGQKTAQDALETIRKKMK